MKEVLLKLLLLQVVILVVCLILSGCSTTSSIKYTESEVQLIPSISFTRAFMPGRLVSIKTNDAKMLLRVESYEGNDYMVGQDEEGNNKLKISLKDIKEIEWIIERPKVEKKSTTSAEDLGVFAINAPLIPVGVVWPIVGSPLGLDDGINSRERQKALLIYGGMTMEELRDNVGEPQERHLCEGGAEVWVYNNNQVLNGGKYIFISNKNQKVYFTSYRFLKKEDCSLLTEQ